MRKEIKEKSKVEIRREKVMKEEEREGEKGKEKGGEEWADTVETDEDLS